MLLESKKQVDINRYENGRNYTPKKAYRYGQFVTNITIITVIVTGDSVGNYG